jgi:hypothetical protein
VFGEVTVDVRVDGGNGVKGVNRNFFHREFPLLAVPGSIRNQNL